MRKTGFFLTIAGILFFVWGCGQWEGGLPENVVVRINQEEVTLEEFNREFREQILEPGKEVTGKSLGDLKKAYLDQMVERKILVQEARRTGDDGFARRVESGHCGDKERLFRERIR